MWSAERGKKEKCIPVLRELVEWHGALTFLLILRLTLLLPLAAFTLFRVCVCVCARLALVLLLLRHQQPAHTRLLSDWDDDDGSSSTPIVQGRTRSLNERTDSNYRLPTARMAKAGRLIACLIHCPAGMFSLFTKLLRPSKTALFVPSVSFIN